jgi:enoyl-CoA hydratase
MTAVEGAAVSTYENLKVERTPPLGVITIDRPRVLNALSRETLAELHRAVDDLGSDDTVRCLIITGSGNKAFVSGADIAELQALETAQAGYEHSRSAHALLFKLEALSKPVIMAVNGYALGGGLELALAGDIILASDSAQLGQPEVSLGIIPGFGGTQRLPRLVGRTRALQIILTGERIGAQEALQLGLVNEVVPQDRLMERAREIGTTIAEKAPLAVALAKRAVYEGLQLGPDAGNRAEMTYFGLAVGTADRREGTQAFLEKRKPHWQGK